jgi:RND family efflux transporter MFP subunit
MRTTRHQTLRERESLPVRIREAAIRHAPALRRRVVGVLITAAAIAVAIPLGRAAWVAYMEAPWTRDATVRAYVATMAPEVAGRIVQLPVADNQFVHRGDLLMEIDPTNYAIAVRLGEATLTQAKVDSDNAAREASRRRPLSGSAISTEQQQIFDTRAVAAEAKRREAVASLDQAHVDLERTRILSPVDGWVTNLQVRLGDYANVGKAILSVVDAHSYWIDAYFEETKLWAIRGGDPVAIKLLGHPEILRGHVAGIARAIDVPNALPNDQGVARVNPIFTWVRLAQRIPVRVEFDSVPDGVVLVAGQTATVEVQPGSGAPAKSAAPNPAP